MASPVNDDFIGVFALSRTSVYATTAQGHVLHYDGVVWNTVFTGFGGFFGVPFALSESLVYIPVVGRTSGSFTSGMLLSSDPTLGGGVETPDPTVTPEPASLALVATGLAACAVARRRRRCAPGG